MSDLIEVTVSRTNQLVDAIASSMMSALEAASQKIELAARVVKVQQRMEAFSAVLDAVGVQKAQLQKRMKTAAPAMKKLLDVQMGLLIKQEAEILLEAGVPEEVVAGALEKADEPARLSEPQSARGKGGVLKI